MGRRNHADKIAARSENLQRFVRRLEDRRAPLALVVLVGRDLERSPSPKCALALPTRLASVDRDAPHSRGPGHWVRIGERA